MTIAIMSGSGHGPVAAACSLTAWQSVLLQFDFKIHGRNQLEKLIGDWETPQIAKWLAFHKLGKYQEAFANTTGKVCGCLHKNPFYTCLQAPALCFHPSQRPAAQLTGFCR